MRGRSNYHKHIISTDEKYNNILVTQFINKVMLCGKKATARYLVYQAIEQAGQKLNANPLDVFEQAVKNASPQLEVRSKRIGGATYQVPMEVRPERKTALAMRWIINAARSRQGKTFDKFLSEEIIDTYNNTGIAIKKKEEMHKMAEANKAFAHFVRF